MGKFVLRGDGQPAGGLVWRVATALLAVAVAALLFDNRGARLAGLKLQHNPEFSVKCAAGSDAGAPAAPLPLPPPLPGARPWHGFPNANASAALRSEYPRRQLDKGLGSFGERSRTRRVLAKLARGEPVTVTFIGGSITFNNKDQLFPGFVAVVRDWLAAAFPGTPQRVFNAGVSGTGSNYQSLCVHQNVPLEADLVFVDTTVNDGGTVGDAPIRRHHERLLRKLLLFPNRPAVVELQLFQYLCEGPRGPREIPFRWNNGDEENGVLSQFYHLPQLVMRSLFWDELNMTRGPGNRLSYLPEPPNDFNHGTIWSKDCMHPVERGHRLIGDMIINWLERSLDDLALDPLSVEDEMEAQTGLTEPMYPRNYQGEGVTCQMGEEFEHLVKQHDPAWQWVNEGTEFKPKWGFVSTEPGSSLQITVSTTLQSQDGGLATLYDIPKELEGLVPLIIAYLRSYEHMGQVELSCVAGCTCEPRVIDGHLEERTSQTHVYPMKVTESDACTIKATVLQNTTSGEHKVKLLGVAQGDDSDYFTFNSWLGEGNDYTVDRRPEPDSRRRLTSQQ